MIIAGGILLQSKNVNGQRREKQQIKDSLRKQYDNKVSFEDDGKMLFFSHFHNNQDCTIMY